MGTLRAFRLIAAGLLCAACVPLAHVPSDAGAVTVEGASGRLSHSQGAAVVARAVARAPDPQKARKLVALMETLGSEPLYKDNEVELLVDGPATYRAMIEAIQSARRFIDLETYIFNDDKIGRMFSDLLIERASTGVHVRVLYDSIGSIGAPDHFFERMRDAGAEVIAFNPANPIAGGNPFKVNNRDHRKLLVVDDEVAFTGGVNIDRKYSTSSGGDPSRGHGRGRGGWRDTHIRISGPAVEGCRLLFLANWQRAGGRVPDGSPAPYEKRGDQLVRMLSAVGGQGEQSPIRLAYELAIDNASERAWITQPYFAPDRDFLHTLARAAKRGVDVRIMLPSTSDSAIAQHSSRYRYLGLLKAGVRIFESRDAMVHAKTAVIDGIWSTVGSSNLDYRSFIHNDEANAIVVGAKFGDEMEALFRADLDNSDEITLEAWSHRSYWQRFEEWLANLATYWF